MFHPVMRKPQNPFISFFFFFCLIFFFFILNIAPCSPPTPHFSRKLSSFVWRECRLTNSYVRSPRFIARVTGREGKEQEEEAEGIIRMAMPPPPLYMAAAPTTAEGAGAEATATAPDMVGTFLKLKYSKKKKSN